MDTSNIDLLRLIERDTQLKKVAATEDGEYHGPCPFCGGTDRFLVQPNRDTPRWSCRQCSPRWQDAIAYVMQMQNLDFKRAVEWLGLTLDQRPQHHRAKPKHHPPGPPKQYAALTQPDWQSQAQAFTERSRDMLWSPKGRPVLDYLRSRGLTNAIIQEAKLGFNPRASEALWGQEKVWLHFGVVIPWWYQDKLLRVRFRRLDNQLRPISDPSKKYSQVAGGANGLYMTSPIYSACTVVLVEGELDALLLKAHTWEQSLGCTIPVATGGTNNGRHIRWLPQLFLACQVLVAFDNDANEAGDKGAAWFIDKLGDKAVRVHPTQHDITDMYLAGEDLNAWLEALLFAHAEHNQSGK